MNAPDWLAQFAERYDIRPAAALGDDNSVATERAELAAAYAAKRVPARYRDALPALPQVEQWLATVISQGRCRGDVLTVTNGPSLLLVGATGVGKTHELYGAMRAFALLGVHARWQVISAADLYARLRPRHGVDSEAEFNAIADAPVLAVDDLGAEKTSPWIEEVNFRLINRRYENARPTLFTSNKTGAELRQHLGDRIASRLAEMTSHVPIKGTDRRRAA